MPHSDRCQRTERQPQPRKVLLLEEMCVLVIGHDLLMKFTAVGSAYDYNIKAIPDQDCRRVQRAEKISWNRSGAQRA